MIDEDTRSTLRDLDIAYWDLVDGRRDICVSDIFQSDGTLMFGELEKRGVAEIKKFLDARRVASSSRQTRHLSSNWRCAASADGTITAWSIVTVYSGMGALPVATNVPSSINDVFDRFEHGPAGWRLTLRKFTAIFLGPDAPAFLKS